MPEKIAPDPPQRTVLRIFKLIRHLATPPHKGVHQLADWLGVDKRSIYRYVKLLDAMGYDIDQDFENRYFIPEADPRKPNQFTAEESQLVRQLLAALPESHPLLESIKKKVYLTSELTPLVEDLVDIHRARVVQQLAEAIAQRKQVRLLKYRSINSDQISDRLVEPLGFSENYSQIETFELSSQAIRTFKIQRIEQVEILNIPISNALPADGATTDVFGFSGESLPVQLNLSSRAYHLLIEEYPILRPYTQTRKHPQFPYRFVGEVRSEKGIGRFILGLPSEIEVESPQSLKEYLNGRIAGVRW